MSEDRVVVVRTDAGRLVVVREPAAVLAVTSPAAGPAGPAGPEGPAGPAGPPGSGGGGSLVFTQPIPAAVWGPIEHNFGSRPAAVSLFSGDYSQHFSEFVVQHLDVNTLRISMDTPTAGIALIS